MSLKKHGEWHNLSLFELTHTNSKTLLHLVATDKWYNNTILLIFNWNRLAQ